VVLKEMGAMSVTVARKLVIGLAVIVGLGTISLLIVYDGLRDLRRTVHALFQVEEPTAAAAYEMEINVLGVGMGVLRYLETPEPGNRQRVEKDEADFRQFHAQYTQLARTTQARALADRVEGMYATFSDLGVSLMNARDREEALITTVTRNVERMDAIIDRHLQGPLVDRTAPRALGRIETLLNVEADLAEVGIWLAHYQRFRKAEYRTLIAENGRELRQGLAHFVGYPDLTAAERRWARELQRLSAETLKTIDDVLAIDDAIVRDRERFSALRTAIDDLLDEDIQVLAIRELRAPREKADADATAVVRMMGGLIPLFVLSACGVGLVVTRGISRPVRRLQQGTDAIRRGDLDSRIDARGRDEFAELAHHFNQMVEQLQATTVSKASLEASEARLRASNEDLRREMAERERAEEGQVRLREALHRSRILAAIGALVAGVAHEVRNPLFGIASTVDALEARLARLPTKRDYEQHISVLRGEVERLCRLMQELLEYGKPSSLELTHEPVGPLVDSAIRACRPAADAAGVTVNAHIPPVSLHADATRLTQVFQNLLDNAIHHAPPGSAVSLDIEEIRSSGHRWVECRVSDTGPGFRPQDLPHVFEPFFTRRHKGTGLGLSIVERIVASHGGTIEAGNRTNGGAVMTVRLPAEAPRREEDVVSAREDSHRR
jgi:signal transduction histidine kinase